MRAEQRCGGDGGQCKSDRDQGDAESDGHEYLRGKWKYTSSVGGEDAEVNETDGGRTSNCNWKGAGECGSGPSNPTNAMNEGITTGGG